MVKIFFSFFPEKFKRLYSATPYRPLSSDGTNVISANNIIDQESFSRKREIYISHRWIYRRSKIPRRGVVDYY